jgi:hypothetical protein
MPITYGLETGPIIILILKLKKVRYTTFNIMETHSKIMELGMLCAIIRICLFDKNNYMNYSEWQFASRTLGLPPFSRVAV